MDKTKQYLETARTIDKSNRQILTSDDFMIWIFSDGVKQADIWFNQIMPFAQIAGYKTIFKEEYIKRRAVVLREEFGLNRCQPLGNSVPTFEEYADYMVPTWYLVDEARGILHFNSQTTEYDVVFPHPIIITKRYTNIATGDHYVKILFCDNGAMGEFTETLFTVSNTNQIQTLTKNGVRVTSESAKFLVMFLSAFLSVNIVKIPILRLTSVLGWIGKDFLPYSNNIEFEGNNYTKSILNAVKCEGNFEKWKAIIADSCKNNDFVRAYMATSFASPLLEFTKKPIFITHLWGTAGTAKTTSLLLALSVWGNPKPLMCQWNATVVAAEQKSAILNNIPMSMNESELLHGAWGTFQNYSDFIYMYCEGESKPRGAKDGGLQLGARWNSCCLSNGENSLISERSKEGELVRVIEFNTDDKLFQSEERAIEFSQFAKENFGYAGALFVKKCTEYDLIAMWTRLFEITQNHGVGKQAVAMASLLLGDWLMQCIIYGAPQEKAFTNTIKFFERIKSSMKSAIDIDIIEKAKNFIDSWIAQNANNFIQENDERRPNIIVGAIKHKKAYIINTVFNKVMSEQGYGLEKIKKEFKKRGYFALTSGDSVTVLKRIDTMSTRCYAFDIECKDYDNLIL